MSYRSGMIAILGRPNAGKSTLLNLLVGQKVAAVTDKPQTTRRTIRGIRHSKTSQMVFLDTPGFHHVKAKKSINHWMVEQTKIAIHEADASIILIPADSRWHELDQQLVALIKRSKHPIVIGLNKIDIVAKRRLLPLIDRISQDVSDVPILPISAQTEEGIPQLINELEAILPEGPQLYPADQPTDQTVRQMAAEIIREKIFAASHQEVPYSIAVEIESFEEPERPGGLTRIGALIIVERKSQKMIVIGKAGQFLKNVGTLARQELEELLEGKVFLSLHVKVSKDWTEDPIKLRELGYGS